MTSAKIEIEGLREFRKAIKAIDSDLPKMLRLAHNKAADLVVSKAKPKVKRKSGAAQGTVRAQSTQTSTKIKGGGRKAPYYPWLDFGGRVGEFRQISRPFKADGRYIYSTYFPLRDSGEFQEILLDALDEVADAAGLVIER